MHVIYVCMHLCMYVCNIYMYMLESKSYMERERANLLGLNKLCVMYVYMHLCMCVCIYVCVYVFWKGNSTRGHTEANWPGICCVCMHSCMYVCMYVCVCVVHLETEGHVSGINKICVMYVCVHLCMCACMYVCVCVCTLKSNFYTWREIYQVLIRCVYVYVHIYMCVQEREWRIY
jgi:hypothetical protein